MESNVMIKATDLHKRFGDVEILRGVSLEVGKGEMVSIVGASGAGKTTLLQIIGTLMPFDGGSVEIDGRNIGNLGDTALSKFRNRHIGFVFQFHNLLPEFTALENVMMPALIGSRSRRDAEREARELLEIVNLSDRADHKPSQMSGGELQRAAIARALINRPSVVLADEPTGNLDTKNRDEIYALLESVRERFGQTIVLVTHDENLAERTDRKIVMSDGRIL